MNKKSTFSLLTAMLVFGWALAQNGYQLPNPGFEQWDGGETSEPTHWNTFSSCDGSFAGLASNNHHYRRGGHRPGGNGDYYLTIYTQSILGIKANGNMTTGRVHAGAMSANSSENYNYTQRSNSDHNQPFTATPDSLYVWVSFYAESNSSIAQVTAIIHGDSDYRSPNDDGDPTQYKAIALARTTRTTTSASSMQWKQLQVPFKYLGSADAHYMLINMTTNSEPGAGAANDSLSIDDIEFIYSAWLTDLKYKGNTIAGFEKGKLHYEIHVDDINNVTPADIAFTTEVNDASANVEVLQLDCDTAVEIEVTVTAEDGTTQKVYTILATTSNYVSVIAPEKVAFDLYPNPASNKVEIVGNTAIRIIDMQGRVVMSHNIDGRKCIDISSVATGLYVVQDENGNVKKLFKQ